MHDDTPSDSAAPAPPPDGRSRGNAAGGGLRVVILDVDGVIFRGNFFVHLSRHMGIDVLLAALRDAFLFNIGSLPLTGLLARSFARLRGLPAEALRTVFEAMPRAPHARETVAALKAAGLRVLILSSGVPDALVKRLAEELGADEGAGIDVAVAGGRLTGAIGGDLAREDGKTAFVQAWRTARGLPWRAFAAVGDDDNNLGLMERAGLSIGVRATFGVRRRADILIESADLQDILPPVLHGHAGPPELVPRSELVRRGIHAMAFVWPFLALPNPPAAAALLTAAMLAYTVSEYFRLNGFSVPLIGAVTRHALRARETRRFAFAPLALGFGVLTCLEFPAPVSYVAIGVVAFGDGMASIVGRFWGRLPLPWNRRKTVEGTLAGFAASLCVCLVWLPWPAALLVALFAALLESLPFGDLDNAIVPVAAGLLCLALR
ncbi:MAG TPA: hypothetical protein DCM87_04490 [Planctomycetes bacterium]|nr:hypothetical protein [Planctomycetota bacterium]